MKFIDKESPWVSQFSWSSPSCVGCGVFSKAYRPSLPCSWRWPCRTPVVHQLSQNHACVVEPALLVHAHPSWLHELFPVEHQYVNMCHQCTSLFSGSHVWAGRKEPGTHCLRMLSFPREKIYIIYISIKNIYVVYIISSFPRISEISRETCSVTLTSVRTPTSLV